MYAPRLPVRWVTPSMSTFRSGADGIGAAAVAVDVDVVVRKRIMLSEQSEVGNYVVIEIREGSRVRRSFSGVA